MTAKLIGGSENGEIFYVSQCLKISQELRGLRRAALMQSYFEYFHVFW